MGKSCCIDIVKLALFLEEEERVVALITSIIFGTTWLNLVIEPKLLFPTQSTTFQIVQELSS